MPSEIVLRFRGFNGTLRSTFGGGPALRVSSNSSFGFSHSLVISHCSQTNEKPRRGFTFKAQGSPACRGTLGLHRSKQLTLKGLHNHYTTIECVTAMGLRVLI